ncbi:DUF1385 domain-containing protein, partial [Clostridioides difficile]|nr:DUF1385 domain-containing protein [Clostridioides difficile]
MAKQAVGGQAVIEGVMMQSKDKRAVAVRKSDGEIALKEDRIKSWVRDKNIDKIPFVRGSFVMIDTMIQGIKSLNFSSEFFMEEAEEDKFDLFIKKIFKDKANDIIIIFSLVIAMLLSAGLFIFIPTLVGGAFSKVMPNDFMLNLIEGIIRIAILFAYIVLISR